MAGIDPAADSAAVSAMVWLHCFKEVHIHFHFVFCVGRYLLFNKRKWNLIYQSSGGIL
jgi:hypothetical protein